MFHSVPPVPRAKMERWNANLWVNITGNNNYLSPVTLVLSQQSLVVSQILFFSDLELQTKRQFIIDTTLV